MHISQFGIDLALSLSLTIHLYLIILSPTHHVSKLTYKSSMKQMEHMNS